MLTIQICHMQADPSILTGKSFVGQKPLPAISFHCQNPIPKYLYLYHLKKELLLSESPV